MERKTVRRRVLPGIAMLTALVAAVTGLSGCTDGNGSGTSDQKNGGNTAAPAQPGKYRSLPQPCKAADGKPLKAMLPTSDSLTLEARERLYEGIADASYDGDRHVGCRWNSQVPEGTLLLSVNFERVVSYDRVTTSDDDKAHEVYVNRLTAAQLPFPGPATTPGASPGTPGTNPSGSPAPGGPPAPSPPSAPSATPPGAPAAAPSTTPSTGPVPPSASASSSASPSPSNSPELGSRVLEGLGNEAFLDDKLSAAGATAARARTVRIVFRTSNVIVTVEYSVQPTGPGAVPPSTETQDKARLLAEALVERFNE
ncbi:MULTISPECIES: DUF3558 domain-containing protein [unclassified Streptomyces]|uniref:DUF3558 domain-containing protein n=1 Tax=unclassified Streptomyces TaxID=2593676 RepID=UPI00365018CC